MANNPQIQTNYGGEFLNRLLTLVTTGNELFERGLLHMEQNVGDRFSLPRMRLSKILQKRVEQPTSENSKGQFTIDERVLRPQDVMAYTEFNPRLFEKFWKPFQPTGELVFRELPSDVQEQMLLEVAKVARNELGFHFIQGVQGDGEEQFFNGILTRIVNDADTIKATTSEKTMLARLRAVWQKVPAVMRNDPNFCFLMSANDIDKYDDEITDSSKGADPTSANAVRFKGKRIEGLADWPDDVIVATVASLDIDSNLWAACNLVDDTTAIKVERVTNAGERYFFKMLMKIDTNIVWGQLAVLLDASDDAERLADDRAGVHQERRRENRNGYLLLRELDRCGRWRDGLVFRSEIRRQSQGYGTGQCRRCAQRVFHGQRERKNAEGRGVASRR